MWWLLQYDVIDGYVEARAPFRAEHLALATQFRDRGELVLAGAFADPADGAALVFRADDRAAVEAFVAADPYVANGLVTRWWIREWTVVIGGE